MLAKIDLLVRSESGYRLSRFFAYERTRQNVRQNGGQNGGAYKEGILEPGLKPGKEEQPVQSREDEEIQKAYDEAVQRYLRREGVIR